MGRRPNILDDKETEKVGKLWFFENLSTPKLAIRFGVSGSAIVLAIKRWVRLNNKNFKEVVKQRRELKRR
jgi:hypothetical protein